MTAVGYEYKPNGILLTVIYDLDGGTRIIKKFYDGATEINFDPPEGQEEALNTVIAQCEMWADGDVA